MSRVLVIAEHAANELAPATASTIGAAQALSPKAIDVAVLAADGRAGARAAAAIAGVGRVLLVERPENSPYLASVWAPQIAALAEGFTHVFAPATTFGKDLIPRAAALTGSPALSDINAVDGPNRFRRPVYAGNAIVCVEADPGRILFATIRPTAFTAPESQAEAPIEPIAVSADLPGHTRFVERRVDTQAGPDLQTAATVIAGGRGLGGPEGVELIGRLAASLNAAVGASRAAVDAGWVGNDLQVGQTGKIVAPKLYIGVGISGAIQHLTGIKDAGTIVAINQDADAPLCGLADIVLVDDLFSAVPAMIERLEARRSR